MQHLRKKGFTMTDTVLFEISENFVPVISAADRAVIRPPYLHFSRKYHEYILYYILSGEMYLTEAKVDYILKKNDFLLLDPSLSHRGRQPSHCTFLYVHFSAPIARVQGQSQPSPRPPDPREETSGSVILPKYHGLKGEEAQIICRRTAEELVGAFCSRGTYHKTISSCLFTRLLLTMAQDYAYCLHMDGIPVHGKARQIIPELITYLSQSYFEDISGDMLQEKYHYHFDYLNRQFKKWTGQTVFQYLNTIRIERAKQLLATGYYSVQETARQTGFRDVYYFSRVFKKFTGTTPGKW